MATKTTNYNLTKPAYDEDADIAVINKNMDIIDTKMKEIEESGGGGGGGVSITVDSEFSETSENPLQNKVVTNKFAAIEETINNITFNGLDIGIASYEGDLNNLMCNGIMTRRFLSSCTNKPSSITDGFLFATGTTLSDDGGVVGFQIVVGKDSATYVRRYWYGTWNAWKAL